MIGIDFKKIINNKHSNFICFFLFLLLVFIYLDWAEKWVHRTLIIKSLTAQ